MSLIGPLGYSEPKKARSDVWHVTEDGSVMPRRKDLRVPLGIGKGEAQEGYRVVGAEIVSSVLDYGDESGWFSLFLGS